MAKSKDTLATARRLLSSEIRKSFEEGIAGRGAGPRPPLAELLAQDWLADFKKAVLEGIYQQVGIQKGHYHSDSFTVSYASPLAVELNGLVKQRLAQLLEQISPQIEQAWEKKLPKIHKAVQAAVEAEIDKQLEHVVRDFARDQIRARIEEVAAEAAQKWLSEASSVLAEELGTAETNEP